MDDNGDITRSSTLFPSNTSKKTQKAIQPKVTKIVIMVPPLANGSNVDHESTPQVVKKWFHLDVVLLTEIGHEKAESSHHVIFLMPSQKDGEDNYKTKPIGFPVVSTEHIEHHAKPKITKLHFFVHDNVTADHPTSLLIAPANTNNIASISFGSTYAMDAPITTDSDPNSKFIGRAQGTFTFVGQEEPVLSMAINLVFTEGDYKGSSLCILGNNPISHEYREMPILGGTGVFRLASGIATVNTVIVDIAKLNDILEYHVVIHY
ncbi:OLC1v1035970C1 [Oldenlandia corymbosa var. corymbosa]|uniref:Dirigent protein n=1 Tax=Oldenlandia corymbosa var. corymbosa TaxID=529605 RepID=A0AAV1CVB5_OLDCO|nr:OLC1v1035970C1 [Oldenlandia corymbosa var. corymbosa]